MEFLKMILNLDSSFYFLFIFCGILLYVLIKDHIGEKIGQKGEDKKKIQDILHRVIPDTQNHTPIYAYWHENYGRVTKCWNYAIGLQYDQLIIVPLTIVGKEIGYKDTFFLKKEI